MIGCVDNDAFNGSYAKNPYNFTNLAVSEISIQLILTYSKGQLAVGVVSRQIVCFLLLYDISLCI